jgi:hypothetical protein
MPEALPIPAFIWQRIQVFLKEGKTGKITLNAHGGIVRDASLEERIRDCDQGEVAK